MSQGFERLILALPSLSLQTNTCSEKNYSKIVRLYNFYKNETGNSYPIRLIVSGVFPFALTLRVRVDQFRLGHKQDSLSDSGPHFRTQCSTWHRSKTSINLLNILSSMFIEPGYLMSSSTWKSWNHPRQKLVHDSDRDITLPSLCSFMTPLFRNELQKCCMETRHLYEGLYV